MNQNLAKIRQAESRKLVKAISKCNLKVPRNTALI